jgi:hypothetical protein
MDIRHKIEDGGRSFTKNNHFYFAAAERETKNNEMERDKDDVMIYSIACHHGDIIIFLQLGEKGRESPFTS